MRVPGRSTPVVPVVPAVFVLPSPFSFSAGRSRAGRVAPPLLGRPAGCPTLGPWLPVLAPAAASPARRRFPTTATRGTGYGYALKGRGGAMQRRRVRLGLAISEPDAWPRLSPTHPHAALQRCAAAPAGTRCRIPCAKEAPPRRHPRHGPGAASAAGHGSPAEAQTPGLAGRCSWMPPQGLSPYGHATGSRLPLSAACPSSPPTSASWSAAAR
jgi:hypothetical protein